MAEEEEKATEKAKPKGKGGLIIILLLVVVILGGGAFAAKTFFLKPAATDGAEVASPMAPAENTQNAASAEPGPMVSYPPFTVNLADPGGNRYLRTTIALELSKEKEFPAEVTAKEPKIKDIILSILSSKKFDEVNTAQGKVALKQEILRRLNTVMTGGRVMDIYITEFVVQ